MSDITALPAEPRQRAGKGTARQTRRAGRIPAVIYGNKEKPLMISLENNEFLKLVRKPGFFTRLFDVQVAGVGHRVLPRDVQFDPVSDLPLHVDFLRIAADHRITVSVPVGFSNQDKCPGLKRGGTLNIVRHHIDVQCDATRIPEHITIDLDGLDLGASVHFGAITLPEGVTAVHIDPAATVVTIATPSGLKSEGGEAAAAEAGKA